LHRRCIQYGGTNWNIQGCSRIFQYSNTKTVFESWCYYSNTSNCSNIRMFNFRNKNTIRLLI